MNNNIKEDCLKTIAIYVDWVRSCAEGNAEEKCPVDQKDLRIVLAIFDSIMRAEVGSSKEGKVSDRLPRLPKVNNSKLAEILEASRAKE